MSKRSRFLVILILIALVLFVGVIIRFGSGSKVTLAPREDAIAYYNRGNAKMTRANSTAPLPTTTARLNSIRKTPSLTTTAATPKKPRATVRCDCRLQPGD